MALHFESVWQRFRGSPGGRLFAAAVIAAPFGAFAAAEVYPSPLGITLSAIVAAFLGVLAVGILELRDRRRNRTPEWQERLGRSAEAVRAEYPAIPPEHLPKVAQAIEERTEEQRIPVLVRLGMVLGGLIGLCGVAMLITRVVEFFRSL